MGTGTKVIWNVTQGALTALGGWLGWFLGGWDGFLYALLTFVVCDYITGVMCAVLEKQISSEIGARGIFKKILIFVLVAVGNIVDQYVIGDGSVIRTAVIFFFLSNEGFSLLENAKRLGLPIPEKLSGMLAQIRVRSGIENGNGNENETGKDDEE